MVKTGLSEFRIVTEYVPVSGRREEWEVSFVFNSKTANFAKVTFTEKRAEVEAKQKKSLEDVAFTVEDLREMLNPEKAPPEKQKKLLVISKVAYGHLEKKLAENPQKYAAELKAIKNTLEHIDLALNQFASSKAEERKEILEDLHLVPHYAKEVKRASKEIEPRKKQSLTEGELQSQSAKKKAKEEESRALMREKQVHKAMSKEQIKKENSEFLRKLFDQYGEKMVVKAFNAGGSDKKDIKAYKEGIKLIDEEAKKELRNKCENERFFDEMTSKYGEDRVEACKEVIRRKAPDEMAALEKGREVIPRKLKDKMAAILQEYANENPRPR